MGKADLPAAGTLDLGGRSPSEALDAFHDVARAAPTDVYYLGYSYQGMELSHVNVPPLGGPAANTMFIRYASPEGDMVEITLYTPEQYGQPAGREAPAPGEPDRVFTELGPTRTSLVTRRGDTVVFVVASPDLGRDGMTDLAARLVRAPRWGSVPEAVPHPLRPLLGAQEQVLVAEVRRFLAHQSRPCRSRSSTSNSRCTWWPIMPSRNVLAATPWGSFSAGASTPSRRTSCLCRHTTPARG